MRVIYVVEQNVQVSSSVLTTGFILLINWKPPL